MKRTKITGFFALAFVLGAFCVLGVLLFMLSRMNTELEARQLAAAEKNAREVAGVSLERLMIETEEERAILHSYILEHDKVIDLLGLIETIGKEQGVRVSIQSVNVVSSEEDPYFEELVVQTSAEGSYESVVRVLQLLETLPYQSELSRVAVARGSSSELGTFWEGEFTIRVTKYRES